MRASASFSFEDGIRTSSWNATLALRRRVSMSAIGSVIMSAPASSPRRLGHTGHFARVDHRAEADAAQAKALVHRTRAAAASTPRVSAHLELRCALLLLDESFLCHSLPLALLVAAEREAQGTEQCPTLVVGGSGRHDGDVHTADGIDLVVVDLREDQLLRDAEGVVPPAVDRIRIASPEVADPGDRHAHETVVELPHAVAAQRGLGPDGVALPELEAGDRLLRPGDERLLPGDEREVGDRAVEQRG